MIKMNTSCFYTAVFDNHEKTLRYISDEQSETTTIQVVSSDGVLFQHTEPGVWQWGSTFGDYETLDFAIMTAFGDGYQGVPEDAFLMFIYEDDTGAWHSITLTLGFLTKYESTEVDVFEGDTRTDSEKFRQKLKQFLDNEVAPLGKSKS